MIRHSTYLFFSVLILVQLVSSCAEPSMPQGGPADRKAPELHSKKYSTPNEMTNFEYNEVILTFDEWVKLQNAYSEIIISPPLEEKPTIKVKRKSVVIKWKEKLKDSTTYVIHYGESIQDITEGNKVKNLKRAFSTGPFIDSLFTEGQIVDAKTRAPKKDVLVMLYRNLSDSMPLTQRPYYFSKTDAQGRYKIDYIRAGRYQIFALDDQNNDYKYNLANESIAFLDSTFLINDSLQPILRLRMFDEKDSTRIMRQELRHFGALALGFNNELVGQLEVKMIGAPADFTAQIVQQGDSAMVWFDGTLPSEDKWLFEIKNKAENLLDTIKITAVVKDTFTKNAPTVRWVVPQTIESGSNSRKGNNSKKTEAIPLVDTIAKIQNPAQAIELKFNYVIQKLDESQILFQKDTFVSTIDTLGKTIKKDTFGAIELPTIEIDKNNPALLTLKYKWKEGAKYKIIFLPNAITDKWGRPNQDTLSRVYQIEAKDKYGDINAMVTDLDSTIQYVVQLVEGKDKVLASQIVTNQKDFATEYKALKVGSYTIRIIHDELPNGQWDAGSYQGRRQPEKVTNSKKITLKAGWENEMKVSLIPEKREGKKM